MSKFLDRFRYFKQLGDTFAGDHGQELNVNRDWEDSYRSRWQHDKVVRSTHGVNCTGSCSWKIYVKNGLVTWETQQTDYPRTRPDLPDHEPRGCPRGASYSWYLYSANRVKYPMMRKRLLKLWRDAKAEHQDPVAAWLSIISDPEKAQSYKQARGRGGFVRSSWQEVNELIAAANVATIKEFGPDRIVGFSPIPAMSMVSYASGARYLSLIGGACLSFYDWYCDLPPASPMTWGSKRMYQNPQTGITHLTLLLGARTSRKPVRQMPTSLQKSATKGRKLLLSRQITPKSPNSATIG